MTRGGMLDVILVGEDAPAARGARPRSPAARGPRPRSRGRLVVVAGAVLALAAAALVDDDRARDRADRLADVPGLLAPLDGPLSELWRAPGGEVATVTTGHGLVTALFDRPDHALGVIDASTGSRRWTAPLPEISDSRDLECVTVDAAATLASEAAVGSGPLGPATHVVCRVVTERASLADGGQGYASSRLVVFDAATGERVAERPLGSRLSTLAVVGPDLLVVELQRDGHGTVLREDPVTGGVLWTFRTSRPLPDLADGLPVPTAQVQHGVIAVDGPGAWALDPAGALLGEWYPQGSELAAGVRRVLDLTVLPDGRFAVTDATVARDRPGAPAGTVSSGALGPPGPGDGFAIPGRVLTPTVDDGSAPDVLLTVPVGAGQVVAVDTGSGRELWRAEIRVGGEAVLLDRRLVVGSGRGVRAFDVRTGDVQWVAGSEVVPSSPDLLTDGEVLLVPVLQRGRRPELVALGLTDGRERWTAAAPHGVGELRVLDGRLIALSTREVVALG